MAHYKVTISSDFFGNGLENYTYYCHATCEKQAVDETLAFMKCAGWEVARDYTVSTVDLDLSVRYG